MAQTLKELKAANAEAEAAQTDENAEVETEETDAPQAEDEPTETNAVEDEPNETEGDAETPKDEIGETETEDWMKGDGHESQAEKKFTDSDIGIVKSKLTKKLEKRHSTELEQTNARIAELEAQLKAQPVNGQKSTLQRPKRDDFYSDDDPEAAYERAFEDYLIAKTKADRSAEFAATESKRVQEAQAQKIAQGEDAHYDRAAELVAKSGISVDKYQAADTAFKTAIENIVPNGGDNIAAALVARLGKGSEKVVYNIGISAERLNKFTDLLKSDPSGLDAYGYLVERKMELTTSAKRKTNAPAPAPTIKGDVVENADLKSIKKQYKSAKDPQKRFDLRLQAKKAGAIDVNDW